MLSPHRKGGGVLASIASITEVFIALFLSLSIVRGSGPRASPDVAAYEDLIWEIGGRDTQHCRAGGSALFEIMVSFDYW